MSEPAAATLVTGGAGFIGSHICERLLAMGHTVVAVDNLHLGTEANLASFAHHPRFTFINGDVTDRTALATLFAHHPIVRVFHMAANSDIPAGVNDPDVDLGLTFRTTFEVLLACRQHDVKEFVFASSSAVFGELSGRIHELAAPLEPISFYGASKLAAEAFVSVYAHTFGIRSWSFRFPNVIGDRATHGVIFDFLRKLERDPHRLEVLGDGTQTKMYMHVSDLVAGMMYFWQHAHQPLNVLHLGAPELVSVRNIADIVIDESGCSAARIEYTGGDRGWKGDVPRFEYDTSRADAAGWKPRLTGQQAVRQTVKELLASGRFNLPHASVRARVAPDD